MKPFGFRTMAVMLATLVVGVCSLGTAAEAQNNNNRNQRGQAAAPPTVTAQQRTQGMAEAPAIITAGSIPCTLADARRIGQNGTGAAQQTFYEVACTGNLGFVIATRVNQPPQVFTCVEVNAGPSVALHCILPGNANQNALLAPYIAKANVPCTLGQVRPVGQTTQNTLYEVTCTEGNGYVLSMTVPPNPAGAAVMQPCLAFDAGSPVACQLSTRESLMQMIDTLNGTSDRHCPVRDRRYVLTTTAGANYYEIACQDNSGYMLEVNAARHVVRTIPCAAADFVQGGCTLTNAREAQTAQSALYTGLATRAGFNCQVQQYAPLPITRSGQDIVEMKCSNRPDGAIGIFPTSAAGGQAQIIPCAYALIAHFRCSFTPENLQMPTLSADLRSTNHGSCVAAASRYIGETADHKHYVEVSCTDGLAGYILEYTAPPTIRATNAVGCAFARGIGGGCQLPANVAALRTTAPAAPAAGANRPRR